MTPLAELLTLAWNHHQAGDFPQAEQCYRQVLEHQPHHADALHLLGVLACQQGRGEQGVGYLRRAVAVNPDNGEFQANLGAALKQLKQFDEAAACLRRALQLQPNHATACYNLGNIYQDQGRLQDALALYERAVQLQPGYAEARLNRSLLWLLFGDLARGWPEYEWRWQQPAAIPRSFAQPRWDGSELAGRTILVYSEQGLGDALQFVRYGRLLQQRGGRVVLECLPALLRLFAHCPGIDQVIPVDAPLQAIDVQAPLVSVPGLMGTTLETIPAEVPYLFPPAAQVEHWGRKLSGRSGFRVGLTWQGNPSHQNDRRRSVPLSCFAPLARIAGVRLLALQKGAGEEQLQGAFPIEALGPGLEDLTDTAAVMKHLDLVITVDTAIAHLAGALGVPVWVALPYVPDWRWLLHREDSPWYPSMRLFRQTELDNWPEVFTRIAAALQHRLSRGPGTVGQPATVHAGAATGMIPMNSFNELLTLAWQHHQAGNLQQAEQYYRQVLQLNPRHAETLHLLGVLACQTGRADLGIDFIRQAIAVEPGNGDFHCNLGAAYKEVGRVDDAVACYQQALRLKPANATATYNLGNAYREQGQLEEAARYYRQTLHLQPGYADALHQLGNVLHAQGKLDEAADCYQQFLRLRPDNAEAYNNLGIVHRAKGRLDEAVVCFQQAIRVRPNFAEGYTNWAIALADQGKLDEAVARSRQALQLNPRCSDTWYNLGNMLRLQGELDEAGGAFQRALQLQPDQVDAANNWCVILIEQGKLAEAEASCRQMLRRWPEHAAAHNNLGQALLRQGRVAEAIASVREAVRLRPDLANAHSNLLFDLNYDPHIDPDEVYAEHRRWGQRHGQVPRPTSYANDPSPERRLRIGYISPDFRRHAVARYLEPVFAHHDPKQVQVFAYAEVLHPDQVTDRFRSLAHEWRWTCNRSAEQVAQQIRADRIDILVDLAGHTVNNRLDVLARKPAPVQATWLGYMNTTGLDTVDYRLTDEVFDPPGEPSRDTEQLVRLPGGSCCFAPPEDAPEVAPLPALRTGYLTFGSLHNLFKLNAGVFDLWCRVLHALPSARLLMFRNTLVGAAREYVQRQFIERGITAERLDLRVGATAGYLGVYNEIDVTLDVFPYSGGTTTCESLWMGVPVLSLAAGRRPAARGSAGLMASAGLRDWVVETPEQYLRLAVETANNLDRLAAVRAGLRSQLRGTLCDAVRFTRTLEEAYRTMWRAWCAKR